MANADNKFGCRVIGSKNPSYNGQLTRMFIPATDSTAVYVGDLVKLAGSADSRGIPTVAQAAAGDVPCGIVVGVEANPANLGITYRAASTAQYVYVNTDPDALFVIQDDSVGGDLAATNVGQNADVIVAAGSTTSGLSGMELDASTAATTATLVLHIHSLYDVEDNDIGTNAQWVCSFNRHQFGGYAITGV